MGAEVIALRDVLEEQLAEELRVSLPFVRLCANAPVPMHQALDLLAWFLALPLGQRLVVIKNVLQRTRRRTG